MAELVYLLLNLGTLVTAVWLGLYFKLSFVSRWRQTGLALLLVAVPFLAWDAWATAQGHWSFNPAYVTGFGLFGLPVEELLFFPVVSLAALAIWQLLQTMSGHERRVKVLWLGLPALVALVVLGAGWGGGYSMIVSGLVLLLCGLLATYGRSILSTGWLQYQAVLLVLFLLFNSLLTGLPVVSYGEAAIIGLRLGTIPVEDVLYNFLLINTTIVASEAVCRRFR